MVGIRGFEEILALHQEELLVHGTVGAETNVLFFDFVPP